MSFDQILSATKIGASGMAAERLRMEVIANNIANANTTRGVDGNPYRRQEVVFASVLDSVSDGDTHGLGGVRVDGVRPDQTDLPRVYRPGHPHADADGYVTMPNVHMATEMVDLITASRGYEANLKVLRSFREMVQNALSLLRGA